MEILNSFLRIRDAIWDDPTARDFFFIIVVWFSVAIFLIVFRLASPQNWTSRFVAITPRTLVMFGVFGTFFGILIGLLDFNVNDIDKSVSELLEGLKVAFTTSVVGMFFALIFSAVTIIRPPPADKGDDIPDAIHKILKEQKNLLQELVEEQTTTRRDQEKLIKEFREFERKIVDDLVKAIEEIAHNFDVILQDLVGESFKKLTEAVNQLVEWQENYKGYIEKTEQRLNEIVTSIEATKAALETIRIHTEAIPDSVKRLEEILKAVNFTIEAFAELREKAGEALPSIEENLGKITESLTNAGREVENSSQKLSQQMHDSITKIQDDTRKRLEEININTTKWLEDFGGNLVSLSKQFVEDYGPLTVRLQELIRLAEDIESSTIDKKI